MTLVGPDGGERTLTAGEQFQALAYGAGGAVNAELVFAGYGITAPGIHGNGVGYDDFAGLDVKDKIAVVPPPRTAAERPGEPLRRNQDPVGTLTFAAS